MSDKLRCTDLIAESLKAQGVEYVFGIVGIPVIELGFSMQKAGLKYFGFRNEQSASYAACAVGYLTGRPGCCLTVTGPGVIHAVAGMANAKENCWPMITLGGKSESLQDGLGSFQECHQIPYVLEACKFAERVHSPVMVPRMIEQAVRYSMAGRPGSTYLDLPADLLNQTLVGGREAFPQLPRAPGQTMTHASPEAVSAALELLRGAKSPLVIVGKGAAYACAEEEMRAFVEATNIPYLTTPMGKGCIPDDHPQNVIAARSAALQGADVVLLVGARLNWILHFGQPPRYSENVKFIKVDIAEEEMHNGTAASVALVGHAKAIVGQLVAGARANPVKYSSDAAYWKELKAKVESAKSKSAGLAADTSSPLNYYATITCINKHLPKDVFIMSEGADTMDIGRTILDNALPRSRLDAGTFGTMGVGLGQIIAGCAVHPDRKVAAIMGDSAFGFSSGEYETITRFNLNTTIFILNNNGIGGGPMAWKPKWKEPFGALRSPANSLSPDIRYEQLCQAYGGKGFFVESFQELERAVPEALAFVGPSIVHIKINPTAKKKAQDFPFGSPQMMGSAAPKAKAKL